jgi:hAT family C-terminal dimerisation region
MKDDGIDILNYWKRNIIVYPILTMMARDIFAVPVSTVSSEGRNMKVLCAWKTG